MSDITTFWVVPDVRGDWAVVNGDLAHGDDLATAVLISLFTDRSAEPADTPPDGTQDRRGWWGDEGQDVPIGSRLWLLSRSTLNTQVSVLAQSYIVESLAWMISDGVAAGYRVEMTIVKPNQLRAVVTIQQNDGSTRAIQCQWAWDQLAAA